MAMTEDEINQSSDKIEELGKHIVEYAADYELTFPEICGALAAVFTTSLQVIDGKPQRIQVLGAFNALITKTALHHGVI